MLESPDIVADEHNLQQVAKNHPGRETLIRSLETLLTAPFSSFIHIYDAFTPDMTQTMLVDAVTALAPGITYAFVNCVACFTPRLLFDSVLNALAHHDVAWEDGCVVWRGEGGHARSWNDSFDSFIHGLRALNHELAKASGSADPHPAKMVLIFERAERLKDNMPGCIIPLTRLGELTQVDISTVFLSDLRWEDICPSSGSFPAPYRITIDPLSREDTLSYVTSTFPTAPPASPISPYNPTLRPLFVHFAENVHSVCAPSNPHPRELAYIAAARWPGFVSPVLEDWKAQPGGPYAPPGEDARMRLARLFSASLSGALEALYPRAVSVAEWRAANGPPEGFRLAHAQGGGGRAGVRGSAQAQREGKGAGDAGAEAVALPRMSMFVLVAAFLASVNPAKSDLRMLGRAPDGKTRRKRKGGGARKLKPGVVAKVPQRLLGPMAFPLDRLMAVLGTLLEENDHDFHPAHGLGVAPGEMSELEVHRVQTMASILELVSMHLLHRTSASEKIDGSSTFRCGISYELALMLARRIGVPLNDLMWEPN